MKTNILSILFFFVAILIANVSFAQGKAVTANIKVFGNCGMCKERIETALDQTGIKVATWDTKTKNLEVVYNPKKITEQRIHELIAEVGHDTEKVKAKNDVYGKLPFCCLYRDHDHSGMKDDKHSNH
ncbi:MAG TPA: cation transporter [Chryseosolibacter sp.]